MKPYYQKHFRAVISFYKLTLAAFALLLLVGHAQAQSSEIEYPTPVRSNEIEGVIAPRDIGDARLTRHFYSFTGTNGDLTITVEYTNLDGTVDVFAMPDLRTMSTIRMLADMQATTTSKTFYLRQQESLILRVEARTPNDLEGRYRIRFSGAFVPIVGEVQQPEPVTTAESRDTNARRVNSAGARIEEPRQENTATATPTEIPARQPEIVTNTEPSAPARPTPSRTATRTPRRTTRTRTPRRAPSTQPSSTTSAEGTTSAETAPATTPPAAPARTSSARRRSPARTTRPQPEAVPQPEPTTRLIIETRDGTRIEHFMNTVRRVTIENNMVVVVLNDGTTQRQPLANIVRMTIEP